MRINVEDAPMHRGGLGGIHNAGGAGGRQVQDRTYFFGIVRWVNFTESLLIILNDHSDRRYRNSKRKFNVSSEKQIHLPKTTNNTLLWAKRKFEVTVSIRESLFLSAEDSSQQIEALRNELGDYNMVRRNVFSFCVPHAEI